jgi:ubiquinone/menaquinone biosynthesis methyltransferase
MALRDAIATPEGKRRYVRRLFATIADRYDFITGFLSYGQDRRWKQRLLALADLRSTDCVLDLACGTGDILFGAAPTVRCAVGVDVTFRMLQLAKGRRGTVSDGSSHGAARAALITGDMIALPIATERVTVVTVGYGLRNVPDLDQALREIRRVLRPGGRLVSLDFNRPSNAIVRGAYLTYLTIVGSLLGLVLHGDPDTYRYIPESIRKYPGAHGVAARMEQLGFDQVRAIPVLAGFMTIHTANKRQSLANEPR